MSTTIGMSNQVQTRFVNANGLSFEVATLGSGSKLALCLHGFPEHAHSWRYQMPVLAALGYEVWAPNLRGYGRSSRPTRVADYAIEHLLQDVAALIDAAGGKPTTLIAHDWGAVIAWYFAMRALRPLRNLIIVNVPHPAAMAREVRVNARQRSKSWYVLAFQLPWLPERILARNGGHAVAKMIRDTAAHPSRFTAYDLAIFAANASTPAAVGAMLNYYRALVAGGGARRQAQLGFAPIATPTLLLWGEDDMALEKSCTYGTQAFVPSLCTRYLPGISHWAQQDDPETVNAMPLPVLRAVPEHRGLVLVVGRRRALLAEERCVEQFLWFSA